MTTTSLTGKSGYAWVGEGDSTEQRNLTRMFGGGWNWFSTEAFADVGSPSEIIYSAGNYESDGDLVVLTTHDHQMTIDVENRSVAISGVGVLLAKTGAVSVNGVVVMARASPPGPRPNETQS